MIAASTASIILVLKVHACLLVQPGVKPVGEFATPEHGTSLPANNDSFAKTFVLINRLLTIRLCPPRVKRQTRPHAEKQR